ncbi:NADPH-dependent 1-acyldihydroxyacetone phosphate reductase-like [Pyrus ussuriensis x Pyrus communis]|uniref:NADPH-dependent 1-acyldihydroxyacetone phosphate reductase-like n=1 Tax=Pyrus ussuriensis x Pyrus communis TaxID=2448454 RepID=A0A5N5I3B5_9ROSA|nr:NADPH-dependent 1-acyldihydroxyacetone phosphate reductase-like [Pyrus ussuriensis x Pyrus communis]
MPAGCWKSMDKMEEELIVCRKPVNEMGLPSEHSLGEFGECLGHCDRDDDASLARVSALKKGERGGGRR